MKKIVLSAIVLASMFAITSCKKTYSCECKTTLKDPSTGATETHTETKPISQKMKEKQAQSACNQTAEQIVATTYTFSAGYYDVTSVCGIK
jgi:hypothetical protein